MRIVNAQRLANTAYDGIFALGGASLAAKVLHWDNFAWAALVTALFAWGFNLGARQQIRALLKKPCEARN
jgi:hypothetical protein